MLEHCSLVAALGLGSVLPLVIGHFPGSLEDGDALRCLEVGLAEDFLYGSITAEQEKTRY